MSDVELLTMTPSFQLCCSISGNYSLYTSNLPGSSAALLSPSPSAAFLLFTSFLRVLIPSLFIIHPSLLEVFLKAEVITLSSQKKFYFLWELTKMDVTNSWECCPPSFCYSTCSGNIKCAALHIHSSVDRWHFQSPDV